MHVIDPPLTNATTYTIIGTILGGSSLVKPAKGKNCYLSMRGKNLLWMEHKASILAVLAGPHAFLSEKTYRWHSLCYPLFNVLYEQFYKNGKRHLKLSSLERLQDHTWAIWFGDCGEYHDGIVTLNTHVWGKKGTQVIQEYLGYCGCDGKIFCDRGCYRLKLNEEGSATFMKDASKQLPAFMLRRY